MKGFSLVELSIVLVILGLLTGGILAGQSLIRAAELRAVSTEISRYQSALYSFRDKYMALPGDMRNATRFWGDQATGTGACADPAIPDGTPGTCNGDGNGLIGASMAGSDENWRVWQHLAMAGLVEGSYSGVGNATSPYQTLGVNVPASKLSNSGWSLYSRAPGIYINSPWFPLEYGTFLTLGRTHNQTHMGTAPLVAEEMWAIDMKMDDGKPGQGVIVSVTSTLNGCNSSTDSATATYNVTNKTDNCIFTRRNL